MKVLFVGPTLPDAALLAPGLSVQPPAVQGDFYRATQSGAGAIGLIDGGFEYTAPVWHKEILYALSEGVAVYGASSMGALRAAECEAFGMIGIGAIAAAYTSGALVDDSDVAQLHAPQALGWQSLTEPLVNVVATLRHPPLRGALSGAVCDRLEASAQDLHFRDRTWKAILQRHAPGDAQRQRDLLSAIERHTVNQKRDDALLLIQALGAHSGERREQLTTWTFQETTLWQALIRDHSASAATGSSLET